MANVDLPQPDSPTIASVSASRASKLSASLALTVRTRSPPNSAISELDLVVLLQVVDLQHDVAELGGWPALLARAGALQSISSKRMQRVVARLPRHPHRDFAVRRSAGAEIAAARPEVAAGRALVRQGKLPGMAISGRVFLSAPGSGIERNSPWV